MKLVMVANLCLGMELLETKPISCKKERGKLYPEVKSLKER